MTDVDMTSLDQLETEWKAEQSKAHSPAWEEVSSDESEKSEHDPMPSRYERLFYFIFFIFYFFFCFVFVFTYLFFFFYFTLNLF